MSGWGGGYVTDVTYSIGWYRQQSPAMIAMASIIGGSRATVPTGDDPIMLLELGCGFGYGVLAMAASNPTWRVTAVDFNPAHIAAAREWAADAGLTNIDFIEGDLSRWEDNPALRDLPEMDFVTLHGVWTWVPPAARDGIVRLLSQKVRPGGLVHVSYNTLPGWSNRLAAARVLREGGRRSQGRSGTQARQGVKLLRDLLAAKAYYTDETIWPDMIETLDKSTGSYLAHEFMNQDWTPCFSMDVAEAFSAAKLEWVGSGQLTDNFPELMMTDAQREIFHRYADPMMQELIKDMCAPRGLRHDVFARGARRISLSERADILMDVHLTLVKRPEDLPESLSMPVGMAELNPAFYQPVVRALSTRPWRVGDLLKLPGLVGRRDNPAELISILIRADMVEPTSRPMTAPGPEAMRFNSASVRRFNGEQPNLPVAAACRPTGTPVVTPLLSLVLMDCVNDGITDVDRLANFVNSSPEQREAARESVATWLDRFLPVLRNAGVC